VPISLARALRLCAEHEAPMERVLRNLNRTLPPTLESRIALQLSGIPWPQVRLDYWRHDELAIVDRCVDHGILSGLLSEVHGLRERVKRRAVWGYKAAGSLSSHALERGAPTAIALYRSSALIAFLSDLAEEPLQPCPISDPHAAAVYWYERPGDRVGFHYDVSHYEGARYTALIGLEDRSSSRLQCRLRARDRRSRAHTIEVQTAPGKLVFFNGDKLLHAVSPIAPGERRIVLSLQYVTDARMRPWRRVISTLKDSVAYFGLDALLPSRV
jgi:hypothetical protein